MTRPCPCGRRAPVSTPRSTRCWRTRPALRAVVEIGVAREPTAPRMLTWDDAIEAARDEYVAEKADRKGLAIRSDPPG